jgi:hypothetical protein
MNRMVNALLNALAILVVLTIAALLGIGAVGAGILLAVALR